MMSDTFTAERLERLKALFPQYRDFFLNEFYEVDEALKEKYPELSTTERIEHVVAICSLILGFEN